MEKDLTPKEKLKDVYLDLNIRRIANRYFNKTGGWLYHKFDRIDVNGNGKKDDFSDEELSKLKSALLDFSERIKLAAEKL